MVSGVFKKVTLWHWLGGLVLVGIAMGWYSTTLPEYQNSLSASELQRKSEELTGSTDPAVFSGKYHELESTNRTAKKDFFDAGTGLVSLAISLALLWAVLGVRKSADFRSLCTPKWPVLLGVANAVWVGIIPASEWYYTFRAQRGDYPWWADSIAIALVGVHALAIVGFGCINLLAGLFIAFGRFGGPLFPAAQGNARRWLVEIAPGSFVALSAVCLAWLVADGDFFAVPIAVYFVYFWLCLRAALLFRWSSSTSP